MNLKILIILSLLWLLIKVIFLEVQIKEWDKVTTPTTNSTITSRTKPLMEQLYHLLCNKLKIPLIPSIKEIRRQEVESMAIMPLEVEARLGFSKQIMVYLQKNLTTSFSQVKST